MIYAAVGGRLSLVGAVCGALLVNAGKTLFSENFPELWLFLMAALFIGVTMAMPNGLAGVVQSKIMPWWRRRQTERLALRERVAAAHAAVPDSLGARAAPPPAAKPPLRVSGASPEAAR